MKGGVDGGQGVETGWSRPYRECMRVALGGSRRDGGKVE